MGIISSIFGERPSAPQTGGFTVGAEIPKELAPYYKDILGKSQALYDDSVSQGYKPYTGPSLADFTPEQQQAFTGIAGLQGQQAPIYQEAMGMTRDSATPITTEQIEEYMNPYQQAVVDVEKREATKQYQSQVQPQLAAQAARIQPFGGSRQAILEGMAADTQQRLLGDIQAKGSAQAYQDSVNLLNQQRMQQGQAAGQLATMGSNQFKSQLGELGALQTVGEEKQQLAQQALNEAYGQYVKEQEYPYQQLGRYQSVVTGAPIQQTQYVPPTPPGPSVGQQLLGGAATMLGTYGAFGGKMPSLFGTQSAKTGGGIGDLPIIKRQSPGPVNEWNMYNSATGYDARNKKKDLERAEAEAKRIENLSDGLSFYKNILKNNPRTTARDLREIQNISNINTAYRSPNIPANSEGNSIAAIKNVIKDRYTGLRKIIQDKMIAKASRDDLKWSRLTDRDSPFSDRNKPPMYAEKKDVRAPAPVTQDLNALKQIGLEYIGDAADAVEWTENKGRGAWNKLVKIGEEYFLQEGDTSNLTVDLLEKGSVRQDIIANAAKSDINLDIAANDQEAIARFDALSIDKREDWDKGIIKRDNKIFIDTKETIEGGRDATLNVLERLYIDLSSYNDAQSNKAGHRKKTIEKAENLLELNSNKEIKNLNDKPVKIIKEITNDNSAINKNIISQDNKIKKIVKGYSTAVNKADKKGKEVPKSVLDNKQAAYLKAIENMNKGLDKKDALIGKAQQESFWAFVARVGANISKGTAIAESVASELPQAMKDRQSLIQAQSDLDDKKQQGKVSLAKADLTIETADAAAIAAREKEERGYASKKEIAEIAAEGRPKYQTLSSLDDSEAFIGTVFKDYKNTLNQTPNMANDLLKISKIEGINSSNFNEVFNQFMSDNNLKDRVYNRAKSDSKGRDRGELDQLYRYHLKKEWEDYSGEFRKGEWLGKFSTKVRPTKRTY